MSTFVAGNVMKVTNAAGEFGIQSAGYVQGMAQDAPNTRFDLTQGILASSETLPMWPGVAIAEKLPTSLANGGGVAGNQITRAANNAGISGFSVANQWYGAVETTSSEVPSAGIGMSVNFYRLGSGVLIPLQIDPTIVNGLLNGSISQQVSWDFTNQRIIAYSGGIGALAVKIININNGNSKVVSYDGTNNLVNYVNTGACALVLI